MNSKKKAGRPEMPHNKRRDTLIKSRVTREEAQLAQELAIRENLSVSEWVRRQVKKAIKRDRKKSQS